MSNEVSVGEAIEALRAELEDAVRRGERAPVRFGLGPIQLELTAALTKKADAKLGWKIIEVGGVIEAAHTQKLTVTLTPQRRDASGTYTTEFLVAGLLPTPTDDAAGPAGTPDDSWAPVNPGGPDV